MIERNKKHEHFAMTQARGRSPPHCRPPGWGSAPFAKELCSSTGPPLHLHRLAHAFSPPSLAPASSHSRLRFLSYPCLKTVSEQISFISLRIPLGLPAVLRVSLCPPFAFPSVLTVTRLRFLGEVTQGPLPLPPRVRYQSFL